MEEEIKKLKKYLLNKRFENDDDIIVMINKFLNGKHSVIDENTLIVKGRPIDKTIFEDEFQDFEKIVIIGTKNDDLYDFSLYYAKARLENIIIAVDYEIL